MRKNQATTRPRTTFFFRTVLNFTLVIGFSVHGDYEFPKDQTSSIGHGWVMFSGGCDTVSDVRIAIKLLCNLCGYDYSPPGDDWNLDFWNVGERPANLPAAGGGLTSGSGSASSGSATVGEASGTPALAVGGQSAIVSSWRAVA